MDESRAGDHDEIAEQQDLQWWQDIPKYRQLLTEELRLLRTACGWPSRAEIAAETEVGGVGVGLSNISNIFNGRHNLSSWSSYRRVIEVLGGDLRYFYPLFLRASGMRGAKQQLERFEKIMAEGLPTLADPDALPFVLPGESDHESAILTFVDEPPPLGEKVRLPHDLIAMQLRENPGRWATTPALTAQHTTSITSGGISAYRPAGSFQAVWRLGRLYIRYVGEDGEYA